MITLMFRLLCTVLLQKELSQVHTTALNVGRSVHLKRFFQDKPSEPQVYSEMVMHKEHWILTRMLSTAFQSFMGASTQSLIQSVKSA